MSGKREGRGKMGRLPGRFVALVVVLALINRVSSTEDRDTVSKAAEVLMNEGDVLKIECIGSPNVDSIIYPKDLGDAITTSTPDMSGVIEDGVYKYQFHRRHTVHGDTGLYGCPYHPIEVTTGNVTKSYLEFVYVYVQSNTNVFVQADTFVSLREAVGGTTIIPCKPTSPNFTVHLWFDDTHERNEPFDPRIGFTLTNLTLRDSGYFKCVIERDDMVHEVNYHLLVLRKQMLKEPKIMENSLRHVTRGQTLRVNCTTEVDADMQYVFNWSTPFQSSRISTRLTSKKYGPVQHIANELIIEDVRDEDEGWYECSITSFYDTRKTKKYITIHDPENKFINLTAQDSDRHYQRREGDKVQWVVDVNAYPQPDLKWLNTKGEEIVGNWDSIDKVKYAVKMTPSSTILRINHLNIDDMGEYSLQATNPDRIEMLNFTLDVLVRPVPMLRVEPYYKPNQEVEISCDVATFPSPNITWTFLRCPYYPSYEDANVEELTNTKESGMGTRFRSIVKTTIEVSGHLTCIACNIIGCESQTEVVLVSDVRGGFGIIEPKGNITEGDDLEVACAASVYNYTNYFEWKYLNNTPIKQSKRLTIVETKTPFTYRSILKIKNVTKEDSTTYTCSNKEEMEFFLRVYDAKAPYLIESNLYKNETTIDFNTEGHKTVILKCYVGGMPRPKVTWHKDDVQIENTESDQYMCVNNCQEMHINYLRENDSGKFSCRIENRFGSLESYMMIVVKGKELPRELIALIVILVVTVIALFIYFTIKVRREKIMRKELMEAGLMHFEEGAVECLNPDLTVDDQAELLPYDKKWEFPREKLKLGKQLGSGAFGVVMKAEAEGICESETITTVAVKMVRRTTDPTYVRALASELKIMVHLGKHLNVVNLLGACTKNISKRELLVIVEYCRFGNLHNYLLRHRSDFINQIDPATGKFDPNIGLDLLTRSFSVSSNNRIKYAVLSFSRSLSGNSGTDSANCQTSPVDSQGVSMSPDGCVLSNNSIQPGWRSNYRGDYKDHNLKPICTQDLLSWAFQVARGMEYLSQRKVLHGDLAARNILLAEDNVVKICDFGMAKTIYKDNNYKKKGDGLLPIKWMAIESIRDQIFSTQSDIWSFGIILWEFFTLAETPYPGMGAEKQYQKLIEGYRMEQPEYATTEVYDIMLQCWKAKPTLRPSFTELVDSIGNLLEDSVKSHYISLNDPYLDMNTTLLEGGRSDYLTMLSAPDHTTLSSPGPEYTNLPSSNPPDSAYLCMSPVSQRDESGIFSPRPELLEQNHFEFPSPTSDTEDAELSPMLKKEADNDPYLKPIDVNKRRAEFIRQRQAATAKNQASGDRSIDRDPGYCNAPRNLPLTELNENNDKNSSNETDSVDQSSNENSVSKKDYVPTIIRTPDNYVNMPKQKSDLRIDMPDGFSNPSYVLMSNRGVDQTRV